VLGVAGSDADAVASDEQLRPVLKDLYRAPISGVRTRVTQQRLLQLLQLQLSDFKHHLRTEEQLLCTA
jgi:hypothetical protein